ncbi:kinesin-like protein KIF21A, partial [Uloborus diversus]|uniref:kinesin-like protein KIF21A n=1 Tax=Uloborus diversus TaxID=327109 RepID=UPI00240A9B23
CENSLQVASMIRPQMPSEVIDMCHVCTSVAPGEPQIWLGNDKAFTFDQVFPMTTKQETVYNSCIKDLIDGCLKGYNATILAYGQTGSGKTYTMGTGFDVSVSEDDKGIIPRAVHHLFDEMARQQNEAQNNNVTPPSFQVLAQFMELYNEDIIDLLDPVRDGDVKNMKKCVKIHEDVDGQIYTVGLTSRSVTSADEALQCLKIGALSRTTASTKMNSQSSRSHAMFTLLMKQQRIIQFEPAEDEEKSENLEEFESLSAKLNFVDLAGSERLKRTGATGERAKEGISINCGLLALGNVISALGDKTRKATHVPYRDSKLTRLIQDSLGGNSQTLMIACVSPSDRDFMETLNTLKYANRAKNIRNKISINQDKSSQTISLLRREVQQLQLELMEYRQGKRLIDGDGEEKINDMYHENMFLQSENDNLKSRLKACQETLDHQTKRLTELLAEKAVGGWVNGENSTQPDMSDVVKGYLMEVETLRVKLLEAEETCSQLRKQLQRHQSRLSFGSPQPISMNDHMFRVTAESPFELINEAKEEIRLMNKQVRALKLDKPVENDCKEESNQVNDDEKEKEDIPEDANNKMNGDIQLNGDIEDEDEDSCDDSDSEEKSSTETYSGDLAQLTHDISIKQKLIEALEQSHQRLRQMRHHYEEKLQQLEQKIKDTESERDRVLANLSSKRGNKSEEKVKKVKEDFEKKLNSLQGELKKMLVIKKEHVKVMRNQAQAERQVQQLKNEVTEMKKTKVRLINKMKEDTQRHLKAEQRRNKEIAQLKKQGRQKENQIRSLEAEKRLKENVLKRKQEELMALRKSAKPMSDRVAGRVPQNKDMTYVINRRDPYFSPKVAKSRWQTVEKCINQLVISKQSVSCTENEMNRYLTERERLTRKLEHLKRKRNAAILEKKSQDIIQDYEDNMETLKANIDYCQENIAECQSTIVQVEEAKLDIDLVDIEQFVSSLPVQETRYMLAKALNMAINQTLQLFQKDAAMKEVNAKLEQSANNTQMHMQLLEQLVRDGDTEIIDYIMDEDPVSESLPSSRSSSPVDSSVSEVTDCSKGNQNCSKDKHRKTALPAELLDTEVKQTNLVPAGSCPSVVEPIENPSMSRLAWSFGPTLQQELEMNKTFTLSTNNAVDHGIVRVTSAPISLQDMALNRKVERSPLARRRTHEKQSHMADFSPAFRRKFYTNASVIPLPTLSRQSSTETTVSDITPPSSPSGSRKSREDNVFSRLTSGSFRLNKPGSGVIVPFSSKIPIPKNSPLICTSVAEGHSRAVLSLHATDDVLFSSSKDRTVKIWDLGTGKEIQSLGGHPNSVVAVRYSEYSRLAFSVSTAYIKVWDVRENPSKCVRTLSSSGASNDGTPTLNTQSRTLQMPQGESQVHDIALNRYGTTLFSAASNLVRIWDLRTYSPVGKLSGSLQSAIMCLAVDNTESDNNVVVTGSKDHYIKVFEVKEGTGELINNKSLKPPHYDGIQSLAINGNFLFSGSRDMCIKKWNLKSGKHIQSLNQAHKDWVLSLSFLPNKDVLMSGCRGGFLKLWASASTQLIGEIKAHSAPINAISTNSSCVFTGSSDCTVGIWRLKNNNDLSPDSNGYAFP